MSYFQDKESRLGNAGQQQAESGLIGWKTIGAGLALAGAALYVRARAKRAEWENPPLGKFLYVNGIRLHYIEKGSGPPLVLLHGNMTMAQDFYISELFDMAARHYRVIAIDRPGYGYSRRPRTSIWGPQAQAELIHGALKQIGVEKAIVLGHSWGTLVAMSLALGYSQSVSALVLESGYYYPTMRPDVPLAVPPAIPVIGDIMRYTTSPIMLRLMWPTLIKRVFQPNAVPRHFREFPAWMAARPLQIRASAEEAATMIPSAMRLQKRYRELSMPVVIISGTEDRITYVSRHAQRLHENLPGSDLRLVEGAGHMLHHVAPLEVMEAINAAASRATGSPSPQQLQATEMTTSDMLR